METLVKIAALKKIADWNRNAATELGVAVDFGKLSDTELKSIYEAAVNEVMNDLEKIARYKDKGRRNKKRKKPLPKALKRRIFAAIGLRLSPF